MEQQAPSLVIIMERTGKIVRRSIHTLLKDFQYFTTTPVLIMLPFSASFLLSQYLYQFFSLANPSNIPLSFSIPFIGHNLSRMVFTCSISFPLAVSSLVMAKASIIQFLYHHHQKRTSGLLISSSFGRIYMLLVPTYLCNIVLTVLIHLATIFLLFIAFQFQGAQLGLQSTNNSLFILLGEIAFYMILTNTMIMSNLSLVMAGMSGCTGWRAINNACLLRKATSSMCLMLYLPFNLGLSAIEALFWFRVVRGHDHHLHGRPNASMVLEGLLIASLYSHLVVLETICCFLFIKEFETSYGREGAQIGYGGIRNEEHRIPNCSQSLEETL